MFGLDPRMMMMMRGGMSGQMPTSPRMGQMMRPPMQQGAMPQGMMPQGPMPQMPQGPQGMGAPSARPAQVPPENALTPKLNNPMMNLPPHIQAMMQQNPGIFQALQGGGGLPSWLQNIIGT